MQEQSVQLDVTVFILNIFFSTPNPTAAIEAQCGTTKRLNYAHSTTRLEKRVKFLKCFVLLTRRVQLSLFHHCGDLNAVLDEIVY